MYWSAGKLFKIMIFDEKSQKSHGKNPKDILRTRQNLVKIYVRSVKIVENPDENHKFVQQTPKDRLTKCQHLVQIWIRSTKIVKIVPRACTTRYLRTSPRNPVHSAEFPRNHPMYNGSPKPTCRRIPFKVFEIPKTEL